MRIFSILALAAFLSACATSGPPEPKQPNWENRVPIHGGQR